MTNVFSFDHLKPGPMIMMTRLTTLAVGCAAAAALTACSVPGGYQTASYRVPDGGKLELKQTLRFPGRSARVYIQYGGFVRRKNVNEWEPYCSFGLDRSRDGKPLVREVPPTVFTVRKTQIGTDIAYEPGAPDGVIPGRPLRVAGLFGGEGPGGTPWPYVHFTKMELFSERQPQVDDLTCAVKGSPVDRNLTLDAIQGAMGEIALIR